MCIRDRTSSTVSYTATANNPTPNNRISSTSLGTVNYDAAGDVTQDNQNPVSYTHLDVYKRQE